MKIIQFTIHGKAATAGSKRVFPIKRKNGSVGVSVAPDNPRAKQWMGAVADRAGEAMGNRPLITGPVKLTCRFTLTRPKGHYGTGRNADKLKDSAPRYHIQKPDLTKLIRAVEDSLTGIVWRDDTQVVSHDESAKSWGERDITTVQITEL